MALNEKMKPETVDEYFASIEEGTKLWQMRRIVRAAAPTATEVISYGMPALKQNKVLVYYALRKTHIGFYPTAAPLEIFKNELKNYKTSKGAIQFPLDAPLPVALIKKIVKFRVAKDKLVKK